MKITRFEEIIAWQKALTFAVMVYMAFNEIKDYAFRDQIQRSAVSVLNNIAEGFERRTDREFRQFLFIAKGSCAEVRSMLYLAEALKYIKPGECQHLMESNKEISMILSGLVKSLNQT